MGMRAVSMLGLAVGLAAVAGWFLWPPDDGSSGELAADDPAAEAADGPSLRVHESAPAEEPAATAKPGDPGYLRPLLDDQGRRRFYTPDTAPPDPAPEGDLTVTLDVRDAETDAPYIGAVELWRLDDPATPQWTRGDRHIGTEATDERGRVRFEGQVAGRYRARFFHRRRGTPHAPAFDVRSSTPVRVTVVCTTDRRLTLQVVDTRGNPLTKARLRMRFAWGKQQRLPSVRPPWLTPRKPKDGARNLPGPLGLHWPPRGGASPPKSLMNEPIALEAGPDGFVIPHAPENDATRRWLISYDVEVPGYTNVLLQVDPDHDDIRHYVAGAFERSKLDDMLRLRDGSRVVDLPYEGVEIEAKGRAQPVKAGAREPAWTSLPVEVVVRRVRGHRTLRRTLRLGELPSELVPRQRK